MNFPALIVGLVAIVVTSLFALIIVMSIRDMMLTSRRWTRLAEVYPLGERAQPAESHYLFRIYLDSRRHPFQDVQFAWTPDGVYLAPGNLTQCLGYKPFFIPAGEFEVAIDPAGFLKYVTLTPKGDRCSPIKIPQSIWNKSGAEPIAA